MPPAVLSKLVPAAEMSIDSGGPAAPGAVYSAWFRLIADPTKPNIARSGHATPRVLGHPGSGVAICDLTSLGGTSGCPGCAASAGQGAVEENAREMGSPVRPLVIFVRRSNDSVPADAVCTSSLRVCVSNAQCQACRCTRVQRESNIVVPHSCPMGAPDMRVCVLVQMLSHGRVPVLREWEKCVENFFFLETVLSKRHLAASCALAASHVFPVFIRV